MRETDVLKQHIAIIIRVSKPCKKPAEASWVCLLNYLLFLLFNPKDGDDMFFQNIELFLNYTALCHHRNGHGYSHDNLKSDKEIMQFWILLQHKNRNCKIISEVYCFLYSFVVYHSLLPHCYVNKEHYLTLQK